LRHPLAALHDGAKWFGEVEGGSLGEEGRKVRERAEKTERGVGG